jgi:hypothetical protein
MYKNEMLPRLSEIMALRMNCNGAYTIFCDYVLSQVVGRNKWKKTRHLNVVSTLATVSDEAFALLLLKNSWDMWIEMAELDSKKGGEPTEKRMKTTKWTQSGAGTIKYGGWKEEGLKQFNILAKKVLEDRKADGGKFETMYQTLKKNDFDCGKGNKTKRRRGAEGEIKKPMEIYIENVKLSNDDGEKEKEKEGTEMEG